MNSFTLNLSLRNGLFSPLTAKLKVLCTTLSGLALLLLFSPAVTGQVVTITPNPCPNCTAEDIKFIEIYVEGSKPTPKCYAYNETVNKSLILSMDVTAKQRYGLLVVGNLYVNDEPKGIIWQCWPDTYNQGPHTDTIKGYYSSSSIGSYRSFSFKAGDKIEVKNVFSAWDNNKPNNNKFGICNNKGYQFPNSWDCKQIAGNSLVPHCKYYESFPVRVPAIPKLTIPSFTNVTCAGTNTGAINLTAEPYTQNYNYSWSGPGFSSSDSDVVNLYAGTYTVTVTVANTNCSAQQSQQIVELSPAIVINSVAKTPVACYGESTGKLKLNVSGGTAPLLYKWTGDADFSAKDSLVNKPAGNYSVTIKDNLGCTKDTTITISGPNSPLGISITKFKNVTCAGAANGKVTFAGTGGTSGYTYSWASGAYTAVDSATGLAPGTYLLRVKDANGCTKDSNITITQPDSLKITAVQLTHVNCKGDSTGKIKLSVTGGTLNYSYRFGASGSFTSKDSALVKAGTYAVRVVDNNGCVADTTVEVKEPQDSLKSKVDSINIVRCHGDKTGKAWVTVTGGTPYKVGAKYTYNWSNGATTDTITNVSAALYTITVKDSLQCSVTKTVKITEPDTLIARIDSINVKCKGDSTGKAWITVSGGTPKKVGAKYTYLWTGGSTSDTLTILKAGLYSVTATDSAGCSVSKSVNITEPGKKLTDTIRVLSNVKCFGDSAGKAYVTGYDGTPYAKRTGRAAYNYSWSPIPTGGGSTDTVNNLKARQYKVTVTDSLLCSITDSVTILGPGSALTATKDSVNIKCKGESSGKAWVSPSGGLKFSDNKYRYAWSNSGNTDTIKNVAAGVYTVNITDSFGCVITRSFNITQPDTGITATMDSINVKCKGDSTGKAWVTASGGTPFKKRAGRPAYNYSWSGGTGSTTDTIRTLKAGTYTVVISDSAGCTFTLSVNIKEPAIILSDTIRVVRNVYCNGDSSGKAYVTGYNGTPYVKRTGRAAYNYAWTPVPTGGGSTDTVNNLKALKYKVTVTDSLGCSVTDSVTITQPTAITATKDSLNIYCKGDSSGFARVAVTAGSGTPYKAAGAKPYVYTWKQLAPTVKNLTSDSARAIGLKAGTYSVEIKDSLGCTLTKTFVLKEPGSVVATDVKGVVNNVSCKDGADGTAFAKGKGGTPFLRTTRKPYNYAWSESTVFTLATTISSKDTATGLSARKYYVQISDSLGCSTIDSVTLTQPATKVQVFGHAIDDTVCLGATIYIVIDSAKGGTPKTVQPDSGYQYRVIRLSGASRIPLSNWSQQDTVEIKLKGPGTYLVEARDSLLCIGIDTVVVVDKECYKFCTYSQGYFGNEGGLSTFNAGTGCRTGVTTKQAIDTALKYWSVNMAGGLQIGGIDISQYHPDTVQAILDFLPGGGPSECIGLVSVFPTDVNQKNTLLTQITALAMNIGINSNLAEFVLLDSFCVQKYSGPFASGSPSGESCRKIYVNKDFVGWTVRQFFDSASKALISNCGSEYKERRNALASLAGTLNEAFEGCGRAVFECHSSAVYVSSGFYEETPSVTEPTVTSTRELKVKAFPNPFTDQVFFRFQSPVAGDALLEIFDFSGRKIAALEKANVKAQEVNLFQYWVPKFNNRQILYRITIGNYAAKGLLIAPSRE